MKTKQSYTVPEIKLIKLDNEISLALESAPPAGPGEYGYNQSNKEYSDPYKTELI